MCSRQWSSRFRQLSHSLTPIEGQGHTAEVTVVQVQVKVRCVVTCDGIPIELYMDAKQEIAKLEMFQNTCLLVWE